MFGFKGFSAAMLGGIGSLPGAVVGGLALGLLEAFGASTFPPISRMPSLLPFCC